MVTRMRWAKERILMRFKKKYSLFGGVSDLPRHIPVSDADSHQLLLHIYHHKILILTFFFFLGKVKIYVCVHTDTHTHKELSLRARLLLAPAWKKRLSQWDYVLCHNLSVVWSEIHNAAHLLLSSAKAVGWNLNRQMPDLGVDILSVSLNLFLSLFFLPIILSFFSFSYLCLFICLFVFKVLHILTFYIRHELTWWEGIRKWRMDGEWRGRGRERQREGGWETEMERNCKLLLWYPRWIVKPGWFFSFI